MKESFFSRFAVLLLVAMAFLDGILIANHFNKKTQSTKATAPVYMEDIFKLYEPENIEVETESELEPEEVFFIPPFTSQAPLGDWSDPWSDFAEEAILAMIQKWSNKEVFASRDEARSILLDFGVNTESEFGDLKTLNLEQMSTLIKKFLALDVQIVDNPNIVSMMEFLDQGALIVAPVNGSILANRYYSNPAPENHMVLIHSYTETVFVTHDPGTRRGENTNYDKQKILDSIQDLNGEMRILIIKP